LAKNVLVFSILFAAFLGGRRGFGEEKRIEI